MADPTTGRPADKTPEELRQERADAAVHRALGRLSRADRALARSLPLDDPANPLRPAVAVARADFAARARKTGD